MKYFSLFVLVLFSSILANAQLSADFSANQTNGCGSLPGVQFTDLSTGNVTSWRWNFGNGNVSQNQSPSANYTYPGQYTVTLIVGDGNNFDTIQKVAYIKVFNNPTSSFTFTPNIGCSPLSVRFTDASTQGDAPITNYDWNFKDGSPSPNQANPTHTYIQVRDYVPNLEITDTNGCKDNFEMDTVTVSPTPTAFFRTAGSRMSCEDTLTVQFVNASTGNIISYLWDFGDGTSSTLANPSHFYSGFGSYDVTLTVTGPFCSATLALTNYVTLQGINAAFTLSKDSICLGGSISTSNQSTSGALYSWDFGDGTQSNSEEPVKTFNDSGLFVVSLSVSAAGCVKVATQSIYVQQAVADFATDTTFSCVRYQPIQFTSTSTNAVSWSWIFEERLIATTQKTKTTSMVENPTLTYGEVDDTFTDWLMIESSLGCKDTIVKIDNRELNQPEIEILSENGDTLEALNEGCAPLTFDYNSILNPPPNVSQSYVYSWNLNGQTFMGSNPPFQFIYNADTTVSISVTATNSFGCVAKDSIIVNPGRKIAPVVSVFPDTVCQGDTIHIVDMTPEANLVDKYNYAINGASYGVINQDETSPGTEFTRYRDTGYHQLRIRYTYNGCDTTVLINNAFYVKGPIARASTMANCLSRGQVSFTGTIIDADKFVWDFGDSIGFDSINVNPTYTYTNLRGYQYTLTAYNDSTGCPPTTYTEIVDLGIPPPPLILPIERDFCLNDSIVVTSANLNSFDSVEWKVNDSLVTLENEFILNTEVAGMYEIKLRVVDFIGCADTIVDTLVINEVIPDFSFDFLNPCFPNLVRLFDNSTATAAIDSAYFIINSVDTMVSLDTTYLFDTPGFHSAFYYVEDIHGCKDSVFDPDFIRTLPLDVDYRTPNLQICQFENVLFRNTSSGLPTDYTWTFGNGDTIISNNDTVRYQFDSVGNFRVTLQGIDINGCIKSHFKMVSVEPSPVAGFTADTLISNCYPLEVQFQDTSTGPITNWLWGIGTSDNSILQNPNFNFTEIGKYDISLIVTTLNGCTDTVVKPQYIQTNGPSADISIDKKEACINEAFTFTVNNLSGAASFIWDFGDGDTSLSTIASHSYSTIGKIYPSLILTDSSGECKVPILDSIRVYDVIADFSITPDSGCAPVDVTLTNSSVGASNLLWNLGDGRTSTETSPTIRFNDAGLYEISLAISSTIGCIDTAFKTVSVFNNPIPIVSRDTGICIGDSVQLTASGGEIYLWSPDEFISSVSNDTVTVFPDSTQIYNVLVSNLEGCTVSKDIEVKVVQTPDLSALRDSSLIIGESLTLNGFAGPHFNYKWVPSEGLSCSNCPYPIAQPLSNQTYRLIIVDDYGCFAILDSITITITEAYSLDVPNAFSPNGDGINDVIFANGWGLKELIAFKIYNRFGELLFESNDFEKGWDGFYRGKAQNVETYIYTVEALTYGDRVLSKKGNISLLR